MAARVAVFFDYQNVYMGAREAFHSYGAQPSDGQVDPQKLAELLVAKSLFDRELAEVRVYRGQPDSQKEPRGYAANARQCQRWQGLSKMSVIYAHASVPARVASRES